jgi:outer membrane receptor protein involved in Fe transport
MPGALSGDYSSFTLVNATLIAKKFLKGYEGLELRGSVYNLFDEDWSIYMGESVPYGWPQPGINFLLEIKYIF